jgi:hypothetical protein
MSSHDVRTRSNIVAPSDVTRILGAGQAKLAKRIDFIEQKATCLRSILFRER